jgi:putative transposase
VLAKIWVDDGYPLAVVARPPGRTGFLMLPRRWVVERSFAGIGRYRRLSKDYEALTTTSAAMIWAEVGTTMPRRVAKRGTSLPPSYLDFSH